MWSSSPDEGEIEALQRELAAAQGARDEARRVGRELFEWIILYLVTVEGCQRHAQMGEENPWLTGEEPFNGRGR